VSSTTLVLLPLSHDAKGIPLMPVGRRIVGFACAAVFVAASAVLAIAQFADGAWIQGALWTASSVFVAVAYGSTLTHWRRP
jgi:hypothetical protein